MKLDPERSPSSPSSPQHQLTICQETCIFISIISNSQILREGLATLLPGRIPMQLIGSYASNADTAIALPGGERHVILLDSGIGRAQALHWTCYWRASTPPAHVIILEMADDVDAILACIEAGAGGYVLKGASIEDVIQVISLTLHGFASCTPELTGRLFARLAATRSQIPVLQAKPPLTVRELEVLHLVAAGYSNQEIATDLYIEVRTVKHHVHNILEKLSLRRRWDAVRMATEQGWLTADSVGHEASLR